MVTVLLVDDDCLILRLCTLVLADIGAFEVLPANDGAEAIRIANYHRGSIDVLVSDVVMPGLTGFQLAETLAQSRPEMKVLLMSGLPYWEPRLNSEWRFLRKPFLPSALVSNIEAALGRPLGTGGQTAA